MNTVWSSEKWLGLQLITEWWGQEKGTVSSQDRVLVWTGEMWAPFLFQSSVYLCPPVSAHCTRQVVLRRWRSPDWASTSAPLGAVRWASPLRMVVFSSPLRSCFEPRPQLNACMLYQHNTMKNTLPLPLRSSWWRGGETSKVTKQGSISCNAGRQGGDWKPSCRWRGRKGSRKGEGWGWAEFFLRLAIQQEA